MMIKTPYLPDRLISLRRARPWLVFLGVLACYGLLTIPSLEHLGIGWDESVDLMISQTYQTPRGVILGSSYDLSQTRLPMFAGALVFHLFDASSLVLARFLSVVVGGVTLLGVFIYGRDNFNSATGLLAVGILAINPFFLAFARMAFTESDIYLACALIWSLVLLARLQKKPSLGLAALSGIFLGFAISSKATVFLVIPVVCAAFVLLRMFSRDSLSDLDPLPARFVWIWSGWTILAILAGVFVSSQLNAGVYSGWAHVLNYGIVCLGWLVTLGWALRHRNFTSAPVALAAFVMGFSLLTFVIFPPEHLANSGIIGRLFSRVDEEMTFSPSFVLELAALHTLTIWLKSTPILGLGLLAGFFVSLARWQRPELFLPLVTVAAYSLTILILPLGQTFYTIPLLPILSLLAAHQLLRLFRKRSRIALALLVSGLIWWGMEISLVYPDYHLNGYQWLGARPVFGRSSIGYRSIVYTPSDGVQQSVEWLNAHAKTGETALLYMDPWHIVKALAPDPAYQYLDGSKYGLDSHPDYVVIHVESMIWQGEGNETPVGDVFRYPFDLDTLKEEYKQVFSVRRAFDLEMASIWERR